MTADVFAESVAALLERTIASPSGPVDAEVRRHAVNGRLLPAIVLSLATGEVYRMTVDRIGEEPSS